MKLLSPQLMSSQNPAKSSQESRLKPSSGFLLLVLLSSATTVSTEATTVLTLTEEKRLEASICRDCLNRIAVADDRIAQVFGDDGTFEMQNDEATGQVFLKPTPENGDRNLSLTLITEQGTTQDLTLKPTGSTSQAVVLRRNEDEEEMKGFDNPRNTGKSLEKSTERNRGRNPDGSMGEDHLASTFPSTASGEILTLFRHVLAGRLPTLEGDEVPSRPLREGCSVNHFQSWKSGGYQIDGFHIHNETPTPLEIEERDFYQPGDVALSFGDTSLDVSALPKVVLAPGKETTLYVVRYRETRRENRP